LPAVLVVRVAVSSALRAHVVEQTLPLEKILEIRKVARVGTAGEVHNEKRMLSLASKMGRRGRLQGMLA